MKLPFYFFKMKTNFFAAFAISATLLVSCNNNDTEAVDASLSTETPPAAASTPATGDSAVVTTPDIILPDSLITNPVIQSKMQPATPAPAVAAPTTAKGLNPAHGQPGHRCDIAVGAPLSSAPAAKPAAPTVTTPTVTTPTVTPASSPAPIQMKPAANSTSPLTPGAKLNPAHGQPGHDCTIPVGAPLKG